MTVLTGQMDPAETTAPSYRAQGVDSNASIGGPAYTAYVGTQVSFIPEAVLDQSRTATRVVSETPSDYFDRLAIGHEAGVIKESIAVRPLRLGGTLAASGFILGMALSLFGNRLALPVFFASAGIFGFGLLSFSIENRIEIIRNRYLVGLTLGLFGIALTGLIAILLGG